MSLYVVTVVVLVAFSAATGVVCWSVGYGAGRAAEFRRASGPATLRLGPLAHRHVVLVVTTPRERHE